MKVKWNRNLDGNSISDQNVSPNRGDAHLSSRFDDGYNDDDDDLVKSRQVFNKSSKKFNSVKASPSSSSKKGVLEEDRKSMAKLSNILGLFKLNPVKCENKSVDTSDRGPHTIRVVRRTYNDNGSNHSLTDPSSVFQTDSRRRRRARKRMEIQVQPKQLQQRSELKDQGQMCLQCLHSIKFKNLRKHFNSLIKIRMDLYQKMTSGQLLTL